MAYRIGSRQKRRYRPISLLTQPIFKTGVRILALHNRTRSLTCRNVIGYDLNDILRTNLFNAIFKLLRNVMSVLNFSLGNYGVQEHWATFGDRHEINERALLCIRQSITANGDPFCFHVALMGSINPST